MKTSAAGINLIKQFEGCSLKRYPDAGGYSIGYGHFIKPNEGFRQITQAQAESLLKADLAKFERDVNMRAKVTLSQNEFDALVSLAYNLGSLSKTTTLLNALNAGNKQAAANSFRLYANSQGKKLPVLVKRRAAEAAYFTKGGDTVASINDVENTSGGGGNNLAGLFVIGAIAIYFLTKSY